MTSLVSLLPFVLAGGSAYGLFCSYGAIRRLQRYEKQSERAARISFAAAEQLRLTRSTQGAAAVMLVISFLASTIFAFIGQPAGFTGLLAHAILLLATIAAYAHVLAFWEGKIKVPFVDGYNEAIDGTFTILQVLRILAIGWGIGAANALMQIALCGWGGERCR